MEPCRRAARPRAAEAAARAAATTEASHTDRARGCWAWAWNVLPLPLPPAKACAATAISELWCRRGRSSAPARMLEPAGKARRQRRQEISSAGASTVRARDLAARVCAPLWSAADGRRRASAAPRRERASIITAQRSRHTSRGCRQPRRTSRRTPRGCLQPRRTSRRTPRGCLQHRPSRPTS